ncbi:MAG: hypothetical protein ACREM8_04640 [Vulcanimicrobiaceae bacterium]
MKNGSSTAEVLDRLHRLGLPVTAKQIENDTTAGFLPPRPVDQFDIGRGRTGLWEPWMARRAERLYRLRQKRDADGRPLVYGDVLRVLLFVRDGWGWSQRVHDVALEGFDKSVAATVAPVRRYTRGQPGREEIEFALDAHDDGVDLTPAERYAAGVLSIGEPLEGGSLQGIFHAAESVGLFHIPPIIYDILKPLGVTDSSSLWEAIGINLAAAPMRVAFEALDDRAAHQALPGLFAFIRLVRSFVHRSAISEGRRGHATNPLSLFGRSQRNLERDFRDQRAPMRITPAQTLAFFIAINILAESISALGFRMAAFALGFAQGDEVRAESLQAHEVLSVALNLGAKVFANPHFQRLLRTKSTYKSVSGPR